MTRGGLFPKPLSAKRGSDVMIATLPKEHRMRPAKFRHRRSRSPRTYRAGADTSLALLAAVFLFDQISPFRHGGLCQIVTWFDCECTFKCADHGMSALRRFLGRRQGGRRVVRCSLLCNAGSLGSSFKDEAALRHVHTCAAKAGIKPDFRHHAVCGAIAPPRSMGIGRVRQLCAGNPLDLGEGHWYFIVLLLSQVIAQWVVFAHSAAHS